MMLENNTSYAEGIVYSKAYCSYFDPHHNIGGNKRRSEHCRECRGIFVRDLTGPLGHCFAHRLSTQDPREEIDGPL
jgi:hypothetical protein